jgi:hypothetical protein
MRVALGVLGTAVAAYGGWLLVDRSDRGDLVEVAVWLAAGVVAHDAVLAGVVVAIAAAAGRLLPPAARAPATVALVVLGSLTVVAFPMLGRFGAREDNPTLLDRPYVTAWLVLVALTALAVTAISLVRSRQHFRPEPPQEE